MLKIIIVVLMIAIMLSLIAGAAFFFKDQGRTKRTMVMLGVRISLATLLMICVAWGLYSGQLEINAPWHNPAVPENQNP